MVGAVAGAGAGVESEAEVAVDGLWWDVLDSDKMEGVGRAVELNMVLQAFAATVEVDGALDDGQLAMQFGGLGGQKG